MSNHSSVVLLVLSGVCLFAAVRHFANGFWRPMDRANILFGVMCCSAACMAFTLAKLYGAWTVPEFTALMKLNLLATLFFYVVFPWFIAAHTGQRAVSWVAALSAVLAVLIVFNFLMPYGMQQTRIDRIVSKPMLWGESIATAVGPLAPTFWIGVTAAFLAMIYAVVRLFLAWRSERTVASLLMMVASVMFLLTSLEGALVRAQLLDFVHLGPVGFFMMVIAMSLILSFRGHHRLLTSEKRFRTLVEQSPFGVQVLDVDGRTLQVNHAWEKIWNKSSCSPTDLLQLLIEKAYAGQGAETGPTRVDDRWILSFVYPLVGSQGRVRNVIAMYADVTDQKRAEDEARAATAELQQLTRAVLQQERLRALGQMAGGIAHDINNAISPASMYVESLLDQPAELSATARDRLGIVQQAIEAVVQTVMRLREFSRPPESSFPSDSVDLNRVAEQAIALSRVRWESVSRQKGVQLRVDFTPTPGLPAIKGFESEIHDAVINLIFNAIDALPEGGVISVKTSGMVNGAAIEVTDNGIGMDEATRRRCLEPFFTSKGKQGTGLGLAMVYGMIKRHRGDIEIVSEPGQGSTFRLRFSGDESPTRASALSPGVRARILIIDDDPTVVALLRTALAGDGYLVMTADDGQSAIDAFELAHKSGAPFAAVITDPDMPTVDGEQFSAAVYRTKPGTPVIMLTQPPNLEELRTRLAALLGAR